MSRMLIASLLLFSAGTPAADQPIANNLGFEQLVEREDGSVGIASWSLGANGYLLTVDDEIRFTGKRSLVMRWQEGARSGFVSQVIDATPLRGKRLSFGGFLRTDDISGNMSVLFLRVDGADGQIRYEMTDSPDPRGTRTWTRYQLEADISEQAEKIYIGLLVRSEGALWADELHVEVLEQSDRPTHKLAASYVSRALALMREHSIHRDDVDWAALEALAQREIQGARYPDETYGLIRALVSRLDDRHSNFITPVELERWASDPPAAGEREQRTPKSETVFGRLAYLEVPGINTGRQDEQQAYAQTLQSLIDSADDAGRCGYLVDLRENRGGVIWPMLLGLAPLLGEGEVGGFLDVDGAGENWVLGRKEIANGEETVLELSGRGVASLRPMPPVALLTGSSTMSAGESVVIAFTGRADSRRFGEDTSGLTTARRGYRLADGAQINLTALTMVDRDGTRYGDRLAVDESVATVSVDGDPPLVADPVIAAAADWLLSQDACR